MKEDEFRKLKSEVDDLKESQFQFNLYSYMLCLPVCVSVCISVCVTVCISVHVSVCISVCVTVCISVCISVCVSVCVSVSLSVSLSVSPSICLWPAFDQPIQILGCLFDVYCLLLCHFPLARDELRVKLGVKDREAEEVRKEKVCVCAHTGINLPFTNPTAI